MADTGTATVTGASSTGETAQTTATATAGTETASAGKTISMEEAERIATDRATRAEQAAMKSYLQQQGMTEDEIKEAIATHKAAKAAKAEADKGNLTAVQKRAEEAESKLTAAQTQAFADLVEAKSEAIAVSLGIDPAKLAYIRLDFSKVGKTDVGKPKAEDIKAVLEGALKVMPELKGTGSADSGTGFKAGTDGSKKNNSNIDDEKIRRIMGLPPKKA